MLIKEVVLENFMSYEFARIPLRSGLNLICGPNGAGKSSILLAISVALGQAYTERSRRLSDLIRRGKDTSRVTVVLDNSPRGGRRPVAEWRVDDLQVSRYLKSTGDYWYEVNFEPTTKAEVTLMLEKFGLNPDNLLLIMHQGMVEEFSVTTPQEKLRMLEEAVGFQSYRQNILEARTRLSQVLSEEQSISSLVENAEQTLGYWRGEYERYLRRNELLKRKAYLERELLWAEVSRQQAVLEGLEERQLRQTRRLERTLKQLEETRQAAEALDGKLHGLRFEQKRLLYTLLENEAERAEAETTIRLMEEFKAKLSPLVEEMRQGAEPPTEDPAAASQKRLSAFISESASRAREQEARLSEAKARSAELREAMGANEAQLTSVTDEVLRERVREGVLNYQKAVIEEELGEIKAKLEEGRRELARLTAAAEKAGERVETHRVPTEVTDEMRLTQAALTALGKVSEDAEKMYSRYSQLYGELKERLAVVSENKALTLREVEERMQVWRNALEKLLEELNREYARILASVAGAGKARLLNSNDLEAAGLELTVGFRGVEPSVLDAYTQSGGERSTAVIAFLLALQQHVKSPFRAVDEYDVHMDPRNREVIFDQLVSSLQGSETQYLVITPSRLPKVGRETHVIMVQNIGGRSEVSQLA
ncbi:MAG: AAA family ATPase [Candidatus Bathyarchaeia archaeon]